MDLGHVSISDKTSYRMISWILEAARKVVQIIASLWNLTVTSAALLSMCLSNFKAISSKYKSRGFETSRDLTIRLFFRILRRGPGLVFICLVTSDSVYRDCMRHCCCSLRQHDIRTYVSIYIPVQCWLLQRKCVQYRSLYVKRHPT